MNTKAKNRVRCRVCGKETAAGSLIDSPNTYSPRGVAWDMRHVRKHKNAAKEWCGGWVLCGRWVPPKGSGTWHVRIRLRGSRKTGMLRIVDRTALWTFIKFARETQPWAGQFTIYAENRRIERDIKPEYRVPVEAFID